MLPRLYSFFLSTSIPPPTVRFVTHSFHLNAVFASSFFNFFLLRRINLNDNKCYWLWVLCDDDDELGDREKSTEISDLKWLLYVPKYIPNRYKYRKNQRLSFCVCVVKWKCSISPLSLSVASNNNKKENWENREFHVIWFHIIWTWKPIKKIKRSSRRKRLKHQ